MPSKIAFQHRFAQLSVLFWTKLMPGGEREHFEASLTAHFESSDFYLGLLPSVDLTQEIELQAVEFSLVEWISVTLFEEMSLAMAIHYLHIHSDILLRS